jgi:hypothetical protein
MQTSENAVYQIGDNVWVKPGAHLYRKALLCFSGEASTSKGPKMLERLQKRRPFWSRSRGVQGVIRAKNALPGDRKFSLFQFYQVEVNMHGLKFDFITTAEWLESRE